VVESDLAQTKVKLEEALEWVKSVQQAVTVDLPRVIEVSFLRSSFTPWSFIGCLNMLASCFVGFGGDVEPQVSFPSDGACPRGQDVVVGHRAQAQAGVRPPRVPQPSGGGDRGASGGATRGRANDRRRAGA